MNGNNQNIIDDCTNDLDKIKQFINRDPLNSLCPYLISYCVIRSCGCLEVCIKNLLFNYLSFGSRQETINYLEKQILDSSWNPSCGSIQKILDQVNSNWSNRFQQLTNGISEKGDLKSLVNLRNDFAHGQQITATIANIISYFEGGCKILAILEQIILNK